MEITEVVKPFIRRGDPILLATFGHLAPWLAHPPRMQEIEGLRPALKLASKTHHKYLSSRTTDNFVCFVRLLSAFNLLYKGKHD